MGYVIKLGTTSALRNYTLKQQGEGIAWQRAGANPFAAKVNTSTPYDQVDIWNEWVQEDWQAGVGRVDPEGGGFLYAEAETRVPNQIILPPLMQQCDTRTIAGTTADCRYMPANVAGTVTVGTSGYTRVAMSFTTPNPLPSTTNSVFFFGRIPHGETVRLAIYSNSGGAPNAEIVTVDVTGQALDKSFYWYGGSLSNAGLAAATQYWLVIYPTGASVDIDIAYGSTGYNTAAQSYNGSVWAAITSTYLLYTSDFYRIASAATGARGFIRFNSILYTHMGSTMYKYDSVNGQFDAVGTITGSGNVTAVEVFGPTLYIGRDSGNYTTMDTAESFSAAATNGKLFLEFKGLLYRAWQNDLYYTSDGSTWSGPYEMGGDSVEIRGMAGLGDSMYCATDKALMRLAPGNVVEEISRFGAEDSTNGRNMLEYQGRLYIPLAGRLFRFDPSGQMQDIWFARDDDMPLARIGAVTSLARMNNWLIAYVLPSTTGYIPSLWVWQEEGWHFLGSTTQGGTASTTGHISYYDRTTSRLWLSVTGAGPMFFDIDDYTLNPYTASSSLYQAFGWLEQDRFYGGLHLVEKDFESVTVVGDNLSANIHVKVYWQDEGSTDWELLGTVDSDGEELRWSNHSTRPAGKWIRLGLLLQSNDGDETPRVRAVIVKFQPMANDRIRDTVTLTLKNYIQMPDGDPDDYTPAQQLTHIQSMIESVIPIIYQDPLGTQYEAKVTDYSMTMPIFAHENSANVVKEMDVTLVLEQVPDGTYSA